ncbi:hypothetical protein JHK86_050049 [Glycine max]|nr:hypothetical protein JHK86_050049 [Glycine max]
MFPGLEGFPNHTENSTDVQDGMDRLSKLLDDICSVHNEAMCSENGAGPERDELDFEFLGNKIGEPYLIQTNVYKNGTRGRKMRHMLWFDPTEDYHTYSIQQELE